MKKILPFILVLLLITGGVYYVSRGNFSSQQNDFAENEGGIVDKIMSLHPLSIEAMRKRDYPGSDLVIEQTLNPGDNYNRYIVSYKSDGLKIYALMTIPQGQKPASGWPAIIFNHGYIPPKEYRTTERYIAYTDAFSRNGYLVIRPDYRGHGNSEGIASGGYGTPDYTVDSLNALASIKKYKEDKEVIVDPQKIGMWGHSMGGQVTLRSMVVTKEIKAGVIWAGVVAPYSDILFNWRRGNRPTPSMTSRASSWRQRFTDQFGDPKTNPAFWNAISPNTFIKDISGPVQIHHGTADYEVPVEFSQTLAKQLKAENKVSELYTYEGDDHNISQNFNIAIQRSVDFFDEYLK